MTQLARRSCVQSPRSATIDGSATDVAMSSTPTNAEARHRTASRTRRSSRLTERMTGAEQTRAAGPPGRRPT